MQFRGNKDEKMDELMIYDLSGKKVFHGYPENDIIDISHLQPGKYIIEVITGQKRIREKLMIE